MKDIITTISVLIALTSVVFAIYNNRKSIYINTITTARIKYLENFRNLIADFSSNVLSSKNITADDKRIETIHRLNFLIKLHLDKNHPFDKKIIGKINFITDHLCVAEKDKLSDEVNSLIELAQDVTLLEWRGIKKEAIRGILSIKRKNDLINNHLKY